MLPRRLWETCQEPFWNNLERRRLHLVAIAVFRGQAQPNVIPDIEAYVGHLGRAVSCVHRAAKQHIETASRGTSRKPLSSP